MEPAARRRASRGLFDFTVAFTVAYALTGSVLVGSLVPLVEQMCNTVAYYFHEKAWERWGGVGSKSGRPHARALPVGSHEGNNNTHLVGARLLPSR